MRMSCRAKPFKVFSCRISDGGCEGPSGDQVPEGCEQSRQWEDTFVRRGEVSVEGPVEDVGDVRAEGVTRARVHRVLGDLVVRHAGALQRNSDDEDNRIKQTAPVRSQNDQPAGC